MNEGEMDIQKILGLLPHRYPLLLVDRVEEANESGIVAVKNVSVNEPFFQGHFPGRPIMPGVLMVEAMAQACGLWVMSRAGGKSLPMLFAGIDSARFRRRVLPGDTLRMRARMEKKVRSMWRFQAQAEVDGKTACAATLLIALVEDDLPK